MISSFFRVLAATAVAVMATTVSGCGFTAGSPSATPEPFHESWVPAPKTVAGLTTLASTATGTLALHTEHGDVEFWSGVDLGATLPGRSPGEVAIEADTYARWFGQMGELGIHFVRIYTIHRPQFYTELKRYNDDHPRAPIYLLQGVYLPDESYVEKGNLFDSAVTTHFTSELTDASAAVGGNLKRVPTPGFADGTWTADVTPWLAGWIIGAELDPNAVVASDVFNASAPETAGVYFRSVATDTPTTPTERWLAARMDELATAEAAAGRSQPIAFVNWPTTDPLTHPTEPWPDEDRVGIDANHVQATAAWPGGTFASIHSYPYYPDFLRYEPAYQKPGLTGALDQWAAYLADLKGHYAEASIPLMNSEYGLPSSLGLAHYGTDERNQGFTSEQEAMAADAAMMRTMSDLGLGGAMLFAWADEWFKHTWNTQPRHSVANAERRALWHDPLTNEQWFGVLTQDLPGSGWRTSYEARKGLTTVAMQTDESYAHLRLEFDKAPTRQFTIGFDIIPGGEAVASITGQETGGNVDTTASDVAIVVDKPGSGSTATAYVRSALDPILLDGHPESDLPKPDAPGWSLQRLSASYAFTEDMVASPAPPEFQKLGELVSGSWNPSAAKYVSTATWQWTTTTEGSGGVRLDLRMPWSMLLLGDPSSHTAVVPVNSQPVAKDVLGIGVTVFQSTTNTGTTGTDVGQIQWEDWQKPNYEERLKVGWEALRSAWNDTSGH
jgi:hypothetical protein